LWIVVVAALIVAEMLVMCVCAPVASQISLGVVYLVGVPVVSGGWGLALVDFFPSDPQVPSELIVLLAVALVLSFRRGDGSPAAAHGRSGRRGGVTQRVRERVVMSERRL
jgi:hypothetical protein